MIEIRELSKRYGGILGIQSLTLTIETGSFFGFVGPNGAGKSTTVNVLTGIIRPTSGKVKILGLELDRNPIEIKKQIGVVPEGVALFEGLTGEEYLMFVSRIYRLSHEEAQQRIRDLLVLFDLEQSGSRLIETYSQGMKKKLAFAAAILHDPKVLFLDEPFDNVDPVSRRIMKDLLVKMKSRGVTIFMTSHALETVETLCDEVAIINKGRIVFQAKTEEIRKRIKNEISQETYQSLEEIFLDVVSGIEEKNKPKSLSWL